MIGLRFDWSTVPLRRADLPRAKRLSNQAAGDYWHVHFLRRHWASGAAARYGYQPRSGKYSRRKQRDAARGLVLAGGRVPLLYKGLMRNLLTQTRVNHATPTHIVMRMTGPRYVTMRPWKSGRPPLGDEATRTTPDELQQLARVYVERASQLIDAALGGK